MSNNGYKWVNRTVYNRLTKEVIEKHDENERILVPDFQGPVGQVTVSGGMTKNLGDFESARIDISFSLPCQPVHEELIRVSDELQTLVSELLAEQVEALEAVQVVK